MNDWEGDNLVDLIGIEPMIFSMPFALIRCICWVVRFAA